jgi:hypothetical protein
MSIAIWKFTGICIFMLIGFGNQNGYFIQIIKIPTGAQKEPKDLHTDFTPVVTVRVKILRLASLAQDDIFSLG